MGAFCAGTPGLVFGELTAFETGFDVGTANGADGTVSRVYVFRFDLMGFASPKGGFYYFYGAQGTSTFTENDEDGSLVGEIAAGLDLGIGSLVGGGRFDLRATYSVLLGSTNASGMALVSVGCRF
jgi:hypothetical protein